MFSLAILIRAGERTGVARTFNLISLMITVFLSLFYDNKDFSPLNSYSFLIVLKKRHKIPKIIPS